MGDYVNQAGEGKNFSPAELEQAGQQFEQLSGIEYYHVRHCSCGAEVFHDGMRAGCRDCAEQAAERIAQGKTGEQADEFQCAACRPLPYPFAELLSEKRWVRLTRLDLAGMVTAAFVVGMAAGWWICR